MDCTGIKVWVEWTALESNCGVQNGLSQYSDVGLGKSEKGGK